MQEKHNNASKAYWLSFAISRYAKSKNLTPDIVFPKLREFGVMDFLDKHYETEHLEDIKCMIEDMDNTNPGYEKTEKQRLFMVEYITGAVANNISRDENISLLEAFENFYKSIWYKRLLNYDTLLYRESAGYVYELYKGN